MNGFYGMQAPIPRYYTRSVQQTIQLNAALNAESQANIDAKEPRINIWKLDELDASMSNLTLDTASSSHTNDKKRPIEKPSASEKRQSIAGPTGSTNGNAGASKTSRFSGLKKALAIKSSEEKAADKTQKIKNKGQDLRNAIVSEENGRWQDEEWRVIVANYQEKVGMTRKIGMAEFMSSAPCDAVCF